jgi:hypothetical protein
MRVCRFWIADYSLRRLDKIFCNYWQNKCTIRKKIYRAKERVASQRASILIPEIDRSAKIQQSYEHIRVIYLINIYILLNLIYLNKNKAVC